MRRENNTLRVIYVFVATLGYLLRRFPSYFTLQEYVELVRFVAERFYEVLRRSMGTLFGPFPQSTSKICDIVKAISEKLKTHQLRHLHENIRLLGSILEASVEIFESANSILKDLYKMSTKSGDNVDEQILSRFSYMEAVRGMLVGEYMAQKDGTYIQLCQEDRDKMLNLLKKSGKTRRAVMTGALVYCASPDNSPIIGRVLTKCKKMSLTRRTRILKVQPLKQCDVDTINNPVYANFGEPLDIPASVEVIPLSSYDTEKGEAVNKFAWDTPYGVLGWPSPADIRKELDAWLRTLPRVAA